MNIEEQRSRMETRHKFGFYTAAERASLAKLMDTMLVADDRAYMPSEGQKYKHGKQQLRYIPKYLTGKGVGRDEKTITINRAAD
jgi:hypothetical protein